MVRFEYLEPKTLQKAITYLSLYSNEAKVLAGGTDLLRALKQRTLRPRYIINIKYIPQISKISRYARSNIKIGAACTMGNLEFSTIVKEKSPALHEAGFSINPENVKKQIEGGVVFGQACAMSEEVIVRDGITLTESLMDYKLPDISIAPKVELNIVESPSKFGPYGALRG